MAITKPRGLKFPKIDYKKKINGRTSFSSTTENFTLEATPQWDGLHGIQTDHLPARASDAIGQTIADPVVTIAGNPRTVRFKSPDGTEPVAGECYVDLYSGTIQFNSADAGLAGSVTYYIRADLIDHNAMNRIWQAGHTYIVSDDSWADFSSLQDAFDACQDGDSIKLQKDITTTGLTLTKKIKLEGNNKTIIKSGSATGARAITFSGDLIVRDLKFQGWDESGDICLYANADVKAIISSNDAIGNTQLTNASSVCTNCIVENNLPFSENVGQATTIVTNNVVDKIVAQFTATTSVSVGQAMFLDLTDPTKCKKSTAPTDADIFLGIALNNASIGQTVNVATRGLLTGLTGLTAGGRYYVNQTGDLTVVAFPNRPIPNVYMDFTYNPNVGTSGDAYHTYIGEALSTTILMLHPKRMNNITKIDCASGGLDIGTGYNIAIGGSKTMNIFSNNGSTPLDFNCPHPWCLDLEVYVKTNALTASASVPAISFSLNQNGASGYGSPQLIERSFLNLGSVSGSLSGGLTSHHNLSLSFKNYNPGVGQVKLVTAMSNPGGTTSGNITLIVSKVRLRFL